MSKSTWHRLIEVFVFLAILAVLLGKLLFSTRGSISFLLFYGLAVTFFVFITIIVAFFFYEDPYQVALVKSRHARKKRPNPLVSCMVAVYNEEANISRCLNSLLRQTYQPKEIIVVNDASTDRTLQILRQYESAQQIRLINLTQNGGKKHALGQAMALAEGEIFAHTDSDSIWAPDALEKIVTIFKYDKDVGAVSGHGRALNGGKNFITKVQDSWMEGQFSARKAFESFFNSVTCVSGPLAVFRKAAVFNYIPAWENDMFLRQEFKFATDRTLTGFVLGSTSIGDKLKEKYKDSAFVKSKKYRSKEWKVVYCKAARSWTIVPDTLPKLMRQQIRWKKSFIRNIFFTGAFFWKKPLPVAASYYLHILLVCMGPFITFRHLLYLPLKGNFFSAVLYLLGIIFIGFMFGLAYKLEEKDSGRWKYRPFMSLLSTLVISWLLLYSLVTIRRMTWTRS